MKCCGKDHLPVLQLRVAAAPFPCHAVISRADNIQKHMRRRWLYDYCLSLLLVLPTRCTARRAA